VAYRLFGRCAVTPSAQMSAACLGVGRSLQAYCATQVDQLLVHGCKSSVLGWLMSAGGRYKPGIRPHRGVIWPGLNRHLAEGATLKTACWHIRRPRLSLRSHSDAAWCWGVPGHRAVIVRLTWRWLSCCYQTWVMDKSLMMQTEASSGSVVSE
jgi:hypothetical protein